MTTSVSAMLTPPAADADVIVASLRDPTRFAEIYERYADQLYRYAHRRLGPDAAEDVVADAFLAAFRRRDRYDAVHADARPWLFGIVTRLIARHVRTERSRYRALARGAAENAVVEDGLADRVVTRLGAAAVRARLAEALLALGAGEREVLLLFAWAQLSYVEIGTALDIPVGTVRSRLNRARRRVRLALGDADPTACDEE